MGRMMRQAAGIGIAFALLLPCACLSMATAPAPGQKTTAPKDRQVPEGQVIFNFTDGVGPIAWSPSGDIFVFVSGNELHDWPRGRTLKLPEDPLVLSGTVLILKWRPDGKQIALHVDKQVVYLIDPGTFRITSTMRKVCSVWWWNGRLCYAPLIHQDDFTRFRRHPWYWGGKKRQGPRGMMITDVSPGGEVMMARVAGRQRGFFANVAVMELDSRTAQPRWTTMVYREPRDGLVVEFTYTDKIVWNARRHAAALVYATGRDGYLSNVSVASEHGAYSIDELPPYLVFTYDSDIIWLGDRVLNELYLFKDAALERDVERLHRLGLWDPWRNKVEWQSWSLQPSMVSPDRTRAVYIRSSDGGMTGALVLAPFECAETGHGKPESNVPNTRSSPRDR